MKEQGALILGSAASNNQKVQVAALEAGVLPLLLKHISDDYEFSVNVHTNLLILIRFNLFKFLLVIFYLGSKKLFICVSNSY